MTDKDLIHIKGGSWLDDAWFCRSAYRRWWLRGLSNFNRGFRIVLKSKANG